MPTTDKQSDLISSGAGLGGAVALESGPELGESEGTVRARGYWEQVWRRLKRDKVAIGSAVFIVFLFLAAFIGAPLASRILGHGPNDIFIGSEAIDQDLIPAGPMTKVHDPI